MVCKRLFATLPWVLQILGVGLCLCIIFLLDMEKAYLSLTSWTLK